MEQFGRVVGVEEGLVKVQVARPSECSGDCKSCGGCPTEFITIEAANTAGAAVGQFVQIDSDVAYFNRAVLWLYGVPLAALIIGILAGTFAHEALGFDGYKELIQIASGFIFMAISFLFVRRADKKMKKEGKFGFEVVKVINKN